MGYEHDEIDATAFRAAYSWCEGTVTPAGISPRRTFKRGTCNMMISANDDHWGVIREILFSMGGYLTEYDGKIFMYAGQERAATKRLGNSDIIKLKEARPAPYYRDRINAATIGITQSEDHDYESYELPEYSDAAAETRDGRRLPTDLGTRAAVKSPARAQMLLAIALRKARAQAVHVYQVKPGDNFEWLTVTPGERLLVTDSESGVSDLKMEVIKTVVNADWSVDITLRHSPDGIYADDTVNLPAAITVPTLPPATTERLPAPSNLTLMAAAGYQGGSIVSTVDASCDFNGSPVTFIISGPNGYADRTVSINVTSANKVEHRFIVPGEGLYTVKAYQLGKGGIPGESASQPVTVSWSGVTPGAVPSPRTIPFATLNTERQVLTLGVVVEWGTTTHDIVVRIAKGDFEAEQVVDRGGQESTRFIVPETGEYAVSIFLRDGPTGRVGPPTALVAVVSTAALIPVQPVVTGTSAAVKVDDGTIRSQVILKWGATPDRARIKIWQGTDITATPYFEKETLEEAVEIDVPNEGVYSWSVELFNAAHTGMARTGMTTVSWADLAPVSTVSVVRFSQGGGGGIMDIVLRQPSERDITGIDLRYRVQAINDETPLTPLTDSNWDSAPRLETRPIVVGFLGNNIIVTAFPPRTGRYRVFGRWVSRAGLRGPVGEIGTAIFALPTGNAGSADFSILWPGTLTEMGPLPDSEHGSILVYDPGDFHRLTRETINGERGWPFARDQEWFMDFPVSTILNREAARVRWRVGSIGVNGNTRLLDGPTIPGDWKVSGLPANIYLRDFDFTLASGLVSVAVNFKDAVGEDAPVQTDPFLVEGVEQDAVWEILYGSTTIDIGGPDHDGTGAVRDATNPYQWTPQTSAQTALKTLFDGLVAQTITDTIRLRIRYRTPSRYRTTIIDLGETANWSIAVQREIEQPPRPATDPIPAVNDNATYTFRYGNTNALGQERTALIGQFTLLPATRFIQLQVDLGDAWSGTGFVTLRLEWQEQL